MASGTSVIEIKEPKDMSIGELYQHLQKESTDDSKAKVEQSSQKQDTNNSTTTQNSTANKGSVSSNEDVYKVKLQEVEKQLKLQQADYTRKTQVVAEERKKLEAQLQGLQEWSKFSVELKNNPDLDAKVRQDFNDILTKYGKESIFAPSDILIDSKAYQDEVSHIQQEAKKLKEIDPTLTGKQIAAILKMSVDPLTLYKAHNLEKITTDSYQRGVRDSENTIATSQKVSSEVKVQTPTSVTKPSKPFSQMTESEKKADILDFVNSIQQGTIKVDERGNILQPA